MGKDRYKWGITGLRAVILSTVLDDEDEDQHCSRYFLATQRVLCCVNGRFEEVVRDLRNPRRFFYFVLGKYRMYTPEKQLSGDVFFF